MLKRPTVAPAVNVGQPPVLSSCPTVTVKSEVALTTQNAKVQAVLNRAQPIVSNDLNQGIKDKKPFDGDLRQWKRQQRLLKNRESASESRKKKKEYLTSLESQVKHLSEQQNLLLQENKALKEHIEHLQNENKQLKSQQEALDPPRKRHATYTFLVLALVFGVGFLSPFIKLKQGAGQLEDIRKHQLSGHVRAISGRALLEYNPDREVVDRQLRDHIFNISMSESHSVTETGEGGTALMKVMPDIVADGKREPSRISQDLDICFGKKKKQKQTNRVRRLRQKPVMTTELATFDASHRLKRLGRRRGVALIGNINSIHYGGFLKAIKRKADTFYVVSLKDHLLLPAEHYNKTQRPKMSFMMPSMAVNGSANLKDGEISLMQIDCEVLDTHTVSIPSSDIEPLEQVAALFSQAHYHSNNHNLSSHKPQVDRLKHGKE
jgi:FtsZ-binding cell division protein ZapB